MNIYVPNQNDIIHETSVDFVLRPCAKEVHIVQYDKSLPIVKVELFRNGERYVLPESGVVVNVRLTKLDRTFVYKSVLGTNEERNIVYFEIDEQMATVPGRLGPVIEIIEGSKVACSSPIHLIIERNPIQEGQIESHDSFPIIYELQSTVADHETRISALENQIGDDVVTLHTNQYDIDGEKGFTSNVSIGGNLNVSGQISGANIVETMNGYSFTKGTTDKGTLNYVYVSMVKNGNKLTIVNAFTFQKNEGATGGFYAGRFLMPNSVASKIIPFITTIVTTAKVQAINSLRDQVTLDISFIKNDTISLNTSVREIKDLDATKTYYIRQEATFLLSDSLVVD